MERNSGHCSGVNWFANAFANAIKRVGRVIAFTHTISEPLANALVHHFDAIDGDGQDGDARQTTPTAT